MCAHSKLTESDDVSFYSQNTVDVAQRALSYPVFMPKPSTHRMHDPGSIVPHIRPKVLTDNQMSRV
jgi:hypothetical protein